MARSTPTETGDELSYRGHELRGRVGVFGEELVWECKDCKARGQKKYVFKSIDCDS